MAATRRAISSRIPPWTKASQSKCTYTAEDDFGSLFKGSFANCSFSINVRGRGM